jgi:hypothetical protein
VNEIVNETDDTREKIDKIVTIASLTFTAVTVARTLRAARRDKDGLQLGEAVLRGATLAVSLAIFVRTLRQSDNEIEEAASA